MLLGALVAAGADQDAVADAVASLGIEGVSVRFATPDALNHASAKAAIGTRVLIRYSSCSERAASHTHHSVSAALTSNSRRHTSQGSF
jgi:uncharacterized protein (DUF111 family)